MAKETEKQQRVDNNSEHRVICHRVLDKLLATLCRPDFTGTATIDVFANEGYIQLPKSTVVRHKDRGD